MNSLRKTICIVTSVIAKFYIFHNSLKQNRAKSWENWKGIRALVNIKSSTNNNINLLDKNNDLINDQLNIANKFNDYFSTIGSAVTNKIQRLL